MMKENNMAMVGVPEGLQRVFSALPRAALAFSGGVDSSYLLYAARKAGMAVQAYYVKSSFQPAFELADAKRLAAELQVTLTVLPLDVLQQKNVAENPQDRCYHCKRAIMSAIVWQAAADGYEVLMDGSNASDDAGDRPGMRALSELAVRSPLREAGLSKAMVREQSKIAGLFTWDKPAYACLATRIPAGTVITEDMLMRIERAEEALFGLGFRDFRVRTLGNLARLQLPEAQMQQAFSQREALRQALSPWFGEVVLDLKPRGG